MTTRSLGYNALFHLKTNATLLDLRRICEDFAPVKYSSMLLYPDVFSLPPRILHPRRTSSRTRSPFLRLLSFSLPNLPFEQQLLARNSDPWTWRIRSHRLEKSRRAWFNILYYTNLFCYVSFPRVTDHRSAVTFPYPVPRSNGTRARFYHLAILVSPLFSPRVSKRGKLSFKARADPREEGDEGEKTGDRRENASSRRLE